MQKNIIVIEGPSGCGKDTLIRMLCEQNPQIKKIASYTDRDPRAGEVHGEHYFFIGTDTFEKKILSGDIFEHTSRHGKYRGMGKSIIDDIIASDGIAVKDVDHIGLLALRDAYPDQVVGIFITADREAIRKRLEQRGHGDVEARLKDYDNSMAISLYYDHIIDNNGTADEGVKKIKMLMEDAHGTKL